MVKGLTMVVPMASGEAFAQVSALLGALGFEAGKGWTDAEGKGAAFLAPLGNLEIVTGRVPAVPALLVEVTQLDAVHAAVRAWLAENKLGQELASPEMTHWNSRLFSVEMAAGLTLGFLESENPLHG